MQVHKQRRHIVTAKEPRIVALADYYEQAEQALRSKVLSNRGRFQRLPGTNRLSPFSEQLGSSDADVILAEAGLKNPLFNNEGKVL